MESLQGMVRQLEAWWAYALRCAQAPASAPACDSFWTWVTVAAVAAAVLIGLYILRKLLTKFVADSEERLRLAERARVADPETMGQYKVDTDKLYFKSEGADVEQRIRQALEERKAKDQWQRPGASGKKDGAE